MLPNKIFFVGAPGSRWSGIAQNIETIPGFNITDRTPDKVYSHHQFSGHLGAYFGTGWEFDTSLDPENLDRPFEHTQGTRILKSHEWAYCLDDIHRRYPKDWIMSERYFSLPENRMRKQIKIRNPNSPDLR